MESLIDFASLQVDLLSLIARTVDPFHHPDRRRRTEAEAEGVRRRRIVEAGVEVTETASMIAIPIDPGASHRAGVRRQGEGEVGATQVIVGADRRPGEENKLRQGVVRAAGEEDAVQVIRATAAAAAAAARIEGRAEIEGEEDGERVVQKTQTLRLSL